MTIYKYPIAITDTQGIRMPAGAKILSAQIQNEVLCIWAMVEPNNKDVIRQIEIIGTGAEIPHNPLKRDYIGTVQHSFFVWHVFDNGVISR